MVAQFKTGLSIGLPVNSIDAHKGRFKTKSYLIYVEIIRHLSRVSFVLCVGLLANFIHEEIVGNFDVNEVGCLNGLLRQPNNHIRVYLTWTKQLNG